jgi:hypothetical protein
MKKIIIILIILLFIFINFTNAQEPSCEGVTYSQALAQLKITLNNYLSNKFNFAFTGADDSVIRGKLNTLLNKDSCKRSNLDYYFYGFKDEDTYDLVFSHFVFSDLWSYGKMISFTLQSGLRDRFYLIFVFDENHNWAKDLRTVPAAQAKYCDTLSSLKTHIESTFDNLYTFGKRYNEFNQTLKEFFNKDLGGLNGDPKGLEKYLRDTCHLEPESATVTCALVNLNKFLDSPSFRNLFEEEGLRALLGGKPAKGNIDSYFFKHEGGIIQKIRNLSKIDPSYVIYYDFDDFNNYKTFKKNVIEPLTAFKDQFEGFIRNCAAWEREGKDIKILQKTLKPIEDIIIKEYGGKINVTTVTVPIAVKPPGFFGKEFSEIKPETIYEAIKDFLFKLAPYVFTLLLIIGGLLYLITPVSDQIRKGSEVIKWAIIGYFLLLVITGVISLVRAIFGGP